MNRPVAGVPPDPYRLDKRSVRAAFDRAAAGYDAAAWLEPEVAERLLDHLQPVRLRPREVLDLGSGTGAGAARLQRRYRGVRVIGLDLSPAMLRCARRKSRFRFSRRLHLCADAEALPLRDASVQLIYSNLLLPWCTDLPALFRGCFRVLADGGLFAFSTLGPETLTELRESWARADRHPHVHGFADMHDLGDALVRHGFSGVVMDTERLVVSYRDTASLFTELKAAGGANLAMGRARGLVGRARFQRMQREYERRRADGRLPATFEIVYGHGWRDPPPPVAVTVDSPRG